MTRLQTVVLASAVTLLGACAHFEGLDQSAPHNAATTPTTERAAPASTHVASPTPAQPPATQQAPSIAAADGDNDGVSDHLDRCPQTTAGTLVDAGGCSVVSPALPPQPN